MSAAGTVLPVRARVAAALGSFVGAVSRRLGTGDGTVIGGRVSLALEPDALRVLASGRRCALVSGTNGKTTTTRLLAAALSTSGAVVTNEGGSNMPGGLVSALSSAGPAALAALEVDEGYLPAVAAQVDPVAAIVLNLSRDQLDRNSEVRMIARRWRSAFEGLGPTLVVANADDPIVAWAAGAAPAVTWVAAGQPWRADASGCPSCEARISFGESWECPACGLQRPEPSVWVDREGVDCAMVTRDGRRLPFSLELPGWFNRANAVMAAVAASAMGVEEKVALEAMSSTSDVGGRYGTVRVNGASARMLLAKNPAGWVGIFDVLHPPPAPVVVAINARVADGRDPSWLWDVAFERLAGRLVVATGERRADLSVRLAYAGVDHVSVADQLEALEVAAGQAGRASSPEGGRGASSQSGAARKGEALEQDGSAQGVQFDYVGNYTAFQALRRAVAGRPGRAGSDRAGSDRAAVLE